MLSGGLSIALLSPRWRPPNLPNGNYLMSVFAASSIKNNYRMEISFVPNC